MSVFVLDKKHVFPPVELAESDGLLAMGGDLDPERLKGAYKKGIFPWYDGQIILWWSPDPRFVLFPEKLYVSKSMKHILKSNQFEFSANRNFKQVIHHCRNINRDGQNGTWITDDMEIAYTQLHQMGIAHSAEAWCNGELAGGLYGVRLGNIFCGESMFSLYPNASKFAFIRLVQLLQEEGVQLIDCQVYTSHLESLGAEMISRNQYLDFINR
jgi:leucyl/phenylalanyl-tRNA---protein transferase